MKKNKARGEIVRGAAFIQECQGMPHSSSGLNEGANKPYGWGESSLCSGAVSINTSGMSRFGEFKEQGSQWCWNG